MENGIRPKARKRAAPDASDIARKAAARAREAEELEEYEMENGVRPTKKKRKAAPVEEESDTENQSIAMRATNKKKDVEDSAPKKKVRCDLLLLVRSLLTCVRRRRRLRSRERN